MRKVSVDVHTLDYSLIEEAADIISQGGVVALPTETVYGLAARADKEEVVDRLYRIKDRPRDRAFTFVVGSVEKALEEYFSTLPPFGYRLIEKHWPGPLTIVYYNKNGEKIGVRVPSHIVTREVLKRISFPVYLPSANISGEKEATTASEVETTFADKIDMVVDGGSCEYCRSSTVVDLTRYPFQVLREGVVAEQDIISVFARKRILFVCTGNTCRSPMAEFLLKKMLAEERPYFNERYEIISRGIYAFTGTPASPIVVDILREKEGIDARSFRARKLDRFIILSSDYIFTMEDSQENYITAIEPTVEGRLFNLKKFLPSEEENDIPDPIGAGNDVNENVYSIIKKAIAELKDWL
jgi:tRNA threonylcarbamoyl adenosine modification protein (Sua5/YciO/YrdC/YwlC family)